MTTAGIRGEQLSYWARVKTCNFRVQTGLGQFDHSWRIADTSSYEGATILA